MEQFHNKHSYNNRRYVYGAYHQQIMGNEHVKKCHFVWDAPNQGGLEMRVWVMSQNQLDGSRDKIDVPYTLAQISV